jgi:hypothetical protein
MRLRIPRTLLFLLALCGSARPQALSSISGTVTDPTGGVIPSAKVTLLEVGTGLTRTATSGPEGYYVIGSLRPTSYYLTAEAPGFRTLTETSVTLLANDSVTMNLKLELGSVGETVNVQANMVQVDTTTATLRQVVDSERMIELPLNGRNAGQLTTLVAGAVTAPSNNADQGTTKTFPGAVTISVNGGRSNNVSYNLDGVHAEDILSNVNQPLPMPDALQEFSVQTSNYSAEYGQNSSGVVNIVTKSGTNVFHGDGFEFVRNAVFNARNFFAASRDPLKRNQFGGTFGGPAIKDKLFFFGGYQGTRIRSFNSGLSSFVPTPADIAGDFSSLLNASDPNNPQKRVIQLKDPSTGQPYPGNLIPVSRFDPASLNMLKYLPSAGGNGLVFYTSPIIQNFNSYITRADYAISAVDRMMFRFNKDWYNQPGIYANNNLLTYTDATPDTSYNGTLQETHIFSPALLNDFRFGVTREVTHRAPPPNVPGVTDFGVQNIYQGPDKSIDGITASGFFTTGGAARGYFARATFAWYDNVRWVRGRHNFAVGGSFEHDRWNKLNALNSYGVFTFSGDATGSALADFLLGKLRSFQQGNGQRQSNRYDLYSLYAQDSYKASSRLTLTYGLRWEPSLPWHELYHEVEVFRPDLYAKGVKSTVFTNTPPGELFSGDPGVPVDGRSPDYKTFAPRIGFAYDVFGDGKTSLRGGGGVFFNSRQPGSVNASQSMISPFSPTVTLTTPQGPFSNPFLGINNPFPLPNPSPKEVVVPTPVAVASWDPYHKLLPAMVYNFNLTIEHQLRDDWFVRAAYVGTRTNHLMTTEEENPAVYTPGSTLSTDQRRIYQPFGSIKLGSASGDSWYNSMQLSLEKRFSRGFTILANYTWSKSLDNLPVGLDAVTPMLNATQVEPTNVTGFKAIDQGPSDFDFEQLFVVSYVWQLPSLSHANRLLRGAAGGWQLSGITTAESGGPLSISAGRDQSQSGIGEDRAVALTPNVYGSGACQGRAPCVDYLMPTAFALPALGSFGTIGKGRFRGPGLFNTDLGIYKRFAISERWSVQFRAEFFNLFNRVNFNNPGLSFSAGGFGSILSARDPRIGQLALKIFF